MEYNVYSKNHSYYGNVKLIENDTGISAHVNNDLIWEADIIEYFEKEYLPGTDAIDIGANVGLHSIALSKIVTKGNNIHSYEMQKEMFSLLSHNTKDLNVIPFHLGISNKSTTGYYKSHINVGNPGGINMHFVEDDDLDTVHVDCLDNIKFEAKVSLVKIDVEGEEANVLAGAINFIKEHKPAIICEIAGGLERDHPTAIEKLSQVKLILSMIDYEMTKISFHDYLLKPVVR
jgi:FkbM family methyltransferase